MAQRPQIGETVSKAVVREAIEGFDVIHVHCSAVLFLRLAANLATVTVTLPRPVPLVMPVRAAVIAMPTSPKRMPVAFHFLAFLNGITGAVAMTFAGADRGTDRLAASNALQGQGTPSPTCVEIAGSRAIFAGRSLANMAVSRAAMGTRVVGGITALGPPRLVTGPGTETMRPLRVVVERTAAAFADSDSARSMSGDYSRTTFGTKAKLLCRRKGSAAQFAVTIHDRTITSVPMNSQWPLAIK